MKKLLIITALSLIYGCSNENSLGIYTCECTNELICIDGFVTIELLEGDYMEINSYKYKYSSSYSNVWSTENKGANGSFFNFYLYPWELRAKYENEYGSSELSCDVSFPNGEEYISE